MFIGAVDGNYAGVSLARSMPKLIFKTMLIDINSPIIGIDKKVDKFKPDYIGGYSSGIGILAREQLGGRIDISPKEIVCSADPLTEDIKKIIVEAFGVTPLNYYAASESPIMAGQCGKYKGLHLFDDWHCFEIVDDEYREVKNGKDGRLILTNLYNYTQPLIRYEMTDRLILEEEKCTCGWKFPVIKKICGRQEEFMWFDQGDGKEDYIHPSVLIEFFVPGLEKLQVEQLSKSEFLIRVKISGNGYEILTTLKNRVNELLEDKGLSGFVSYSVDVVEDIKNNPITGKYNLVIPLKV